MLPCQLHCELPTSSVWIPPNLNAVPLVTKISVSNFQALFCVVRTDGCLVSSPNYRPFDLGVLRHQPLGGQRQ